MEPARPRAPRIDEEHASAFRAARLVRMPADDDVKSGCGWVQIEIVNVVKHVDVGRACFYDGCERQRGSPRFVVNVASDRNDRREKFERLEDFGLPDVPGMNNQVRAFQRSPGFVAQQAVCV
jgi:hypothetical protein